MAKRTRRRRRSWSRLLLLVVFVAAALYAGYFCLFRPPEVPAETTRPDEAEEVSAEDTAQDAEALAQAAHLERKPYFYTILVSGVDDHNGGSDTNILVAVDAENDYIYGVSIPRDTKAVINGKNHKIDRHDRRRPGAGHLSDGGVRPPHPHGGGKCPKGRHRRGGGHDRLLCGGGQHPRGRRDAGLSPGWE